MTAPDPGLDRWRLVLGAAADATLPQLTGDGGACDAAVDWLYGRDDDLRRRGERRGGGHRADPNAPRNAGGGESVLSTFDWLDEIHRLFPTETIERLERDAIERYEIQEIVTDPAALLRIEPNAAVLKAVLRTKHLMNPEVLAVARQLIERVVQELIARLATEVRQAFSGPRSRTPSRIAQSRNFDVRRTIRKNLGHYQPEQRRIVIEQPLFVARSKRYLAPWQVILVVDQSGSMAGSVIHSAVTAACLWGLPGLRTHLIAFDTTVVDLTSDVDDPVELLMRVNLGGGTDIARAVRYATQLVDNPRRAIVVVISDFYEGGDEVLLVRGVRELVEQGTHVLALAALDDDAHPQFDRAMGQRLADVGAGVGAMTPGELAAFVAEHVGR